MEDIKKIQEFFSKPLEEGKQLDQVDFAKVVQAVTKTGHPVTVLLVPKFNEIEVITGMNAPDDVLFDLSNAVDSLGYGSDDIIIAGDSSNLSRREYSDIRRVNGGAKDYFEESVNEGPIEDIQKKLNALGVKYEMSKTDKVRPFKAIYKPINKSDEFYNKFEDIVDLYNLGGVVKTSMNEGAEDIMDAYNDVLDLVKKHSRRLSDDDSYTFGLKLKSWFNKNILDEATKDEETEFHKKLDTLVHDTFGKRKGEMEEYETGIYYKGEETKDKAKDASKSALEKVKDMIQKVLKEEEGYSKFLKTDDNPEGKTKGLDTKTMNKILMNVIKDIEETIELGKQLDEKKLCKKGEAYRKRRMAAGEKSSAYLSGRAVKVCKGQMSGRKKK